MAEEQVGEGVGRVRLVLIREGRAIKVKIRLLRIKIRRIKIIQWPN